MAEKSTRLEALHSTFEENVIPPDDTYRIVMGNINTDHFYQVMVQLLLHTIEGIVSLSGWIWGVSKKY